MAVHAQHGIPGDEEDENEDDADHASFEYEC